MERQAGAWFRPRWLWTASHPPTTNPGIACGFRISFYFRCKMEMNISASHIFPNLVWQKSRETRFCVFPCFLARRKWECQEKTLKWTSWNGCSTSAAARRTGVSRPGPPGPWSSRVFCQTDRKAWVGPQVNVLSTWWDRNPGWIAPSADWI